MRWRLTLEYDGAGFVGWQVQPDQRSVQGVLEAAVATLFGEHVRVSASGRTDAGVHAEGQVISFVAAKPRAADKVRDALNALLPPDVAVLEAAVAPPGFDPRRWTRRKTYRYAWLARRARSPLRNGRVWHLRHPLDVGAMREGGARLVGFHDFTSFRAAGCSATHPRRHVELVEVERRGDEVHLRVVGNGFLRHMVRIIAGTLADVGTGRHDPAWVAEVLAARDRSRAGRTAPARALTLVAVEYGDGPPEWVDG